MNFHRLALLALVSLGLVGSALLADDRDLLRENDGDPFLFVVLDSSSSMTLDFDNGWVHAGADDPRSRIYAAKQALYLILRDLPGIHYGFSTFNQDKLRIVGKHRLYFIPGNPGTVDGIANIQALDALQNFVVSTSSATGLAARYPIEDLDERVEVPELDVNGNPTGFTNVDITGDMLTFGPQIAGVAGGTCGSPLAVGSVRERINRFPKLGTPNQDLVTEMYVSIGGTRYRVTMENTGAAPLGSASMQVTITYQQVSWNGSSCSNVAGSSISRQVTMTKWRAFLMQDDDGGLSPDAGKGGCGAGTGGNDPVGGFWDVNDVTGIFSCANSKPHSGEGWEGNYDTGPPVWTDGGTVETSQSGWDPFLTDADCVSGDCKLLLQGTNYSSTVVPGHADTRELDWGDTITWHWDVDYKDEFLARLNPNHLVGPPDFGVADYFKDNPDPFDPAGRYSLRSGDKPVVASGISPIGSAVLDFRCWATGNSANKCGNPESELYDSGWLNLFADHNADLAKCRVPFVIIITDLYSNCEGSSKVSEVAGMFNQTGSDGGEGISTWLFNVGPEKCNGLTQAGKGEEIKVDSRDTLRDKLEEIIGIILEEQRTFSAAAVPSVQADVGDSIYFTKFRPLQGESVWPGQALSYPKPIPLDLTEDPPVPAEGSELWDGAFVLSSQQAPYPADVPIADGDGATRDELRIGYDSTTRRVFYSNLFEGNSVVTRTTAVNRRPFYRNLFGPAIDHPSTFDENDVRLDLWSGMGQIPTNYSFLNTTDPEDLVELFTKHPIEAMRAHRTFKEVYSIRSAIVDDPELGMFPIEYVMGDVFHSNPLLLDSPQNARYVTNGDDFPGYAQFAELHRRRRKVLLFGANDGQFHVFDAGTWQHNALDPTESTFNDGTGTEIFAYIPRNQLLVVSNRVAVGASSHEWGVDGSPVASDVFIDPCHSGSGATCTGDPDADDRQWRTVVAFGLRRGGKSYTVLDMTLPDPMTEFSVTTSTGATVPEGYRPTTNDPVPSCLEGNPLNHGLVKYNPCNSSLPEIDGFGMKGVIPYGSPLFEFTDNSDDDMNGEPDLGQTWSTPDIGAIHVINSDGDLEVRFVMIFGGGLPDAGTVIDPTVSVSGDWLYMVDIETGKAIYKRELEGAAPAAPAALDIDGDGIIDRVYQGTLAGKMYRVDLTEPVVLDTCSTIANSSDCIESGWDPVVFFDAGPRPIFFRPAIVFLADLGGYGIVFGTGDRNQLWASAPVGGNRLYSIADEVCPFGVSAPGTCLDPASDLPLDETSFDDMTSTSVPIEEGLLNDPSIKGLGERGWYFRFGLTQPTDTLISEPVVPDDELLVTPPFVVSGALVFSTFLPDIDFDSGLCSRRGTSRNYVTLVTNGEPLKESLSTPSDTLVTEPFIQPTSTDREESDDPTRPSTDPCPPDEVQQVSDVLKEVVFDPTCKFSPTLGFDIYHSSSKLGIDCLARVPICIRDFGWKDF